MTSFCGPRSRLAGTLTTPGGTGCTADVDVSCSTVPQQSDATCTGFDVTRRRPMCDFQAIADRVEIEALRGEFTDAAMMRDRARLASLFAPDGALRMPTAEGKR
jgi:hypothetical protein